MMYLCSSFVENIGSSSIVSIVFYPFEFTGTNRFVNNSGTVLRVSAYNSRACFIVLFLMCSGIIVGRSCCHSQ